MKNLSKSYFVGLARLEVLDKDNKVVKDTGFKKNIISDVGLAEIIAILGGLSSDNLLYLAVGSSNASEDASLTSLGSEITSGGLGRELADDPSQETTDVSGDTWQLKNVWDATADHTVREIAMYTKLSGGVMIGRRLTGDVAISNGQKLRATYQIKAMRG